MKTDLGPEYLHAEDLLDGGAWTERTAVVAEVLPPNTVKQADGTLIPKPIVCFEKTSKRLVLGKINRRLLICALGTCKPAEWVGKSITIYAASGSWFGQSNVAALRIRVPAGKPRPFLKPAQLGDDLTGRGV